VRRADNILPVEDYISQNLLPPNEGVILTVLHYWATGLTSRTHEQAAAVVLQDIDALLAQRYPQPKD